VFVRLGRRTLPWHKGLIKSLIEFKPDVILCEGESHILGYLQAICYRCIFARNTALLHWCFISLPGEQRAGRLAIEALKGLLRMHFDAFVVYSSYSKMQLIARGEAAESIFVATNVGDVGRIREKSRHIVGDKGEIRRRLQLPDNFIVLYSGTLESAKRPEIVLDIAKRAECKDHLFVIAGSGVLAGALERRICNEMVKNVRLVGKLGDSLLQYYKAADVLLVPGRGGIVISEAMAMGIPVVAHQADGTEYDLVQPGITGELVETGSDAEFAATLSILKQNPALCEAMGKNALMQIESRFGEAQMVRQIMSAATYAIAKRAC